MAITSIDTSKSSSKR